MFGRLLAMWRSLRQRKQQRGAGSNIAKHLEETAAIQAGLHVAKRLRNRKLGYSLSPRQWRKRRNRRRIAARSRAINRRQR